MSNRAGRSSDPGYHLVLWATACHDFNAAAYLISNPEISRNTVGMHLQQSVEKAAKALLSKRRIAYKFTHEIDKLFAKISAPAEFEALEDLTAFALDLRYELPVSADDFDAEAMIALVQEFMVWVAAEGDFSLD